MTYSQALNQSAANGSMAPKGGSKRLTITDDFERNGNSETFSAEVIKKLGRNTYWIKSGELVGGNNESILELGLYVKNNGKNIINQTPAENGYIIELVGSYLDWRNLLIWIANEKGQKDSDYIMVEFDKNFPLMY